MLGSSTAVVTERDAEWDSAQRALNLCLATAAEHKDPAVREAAGRLRGALLKGAGTEQTTLSYDEEVDYGRQQLLRAAKDPLCTRPSWRSSIATRPPRRAAARAAPRPPARRAATRAPRPPKAPARPADACRATAATPATACRASAVADEAILAYSEEEGPDDPWATWAAAFTLATTSGALGPAPGSGSRSHPSPSSSPKSTPTWSSIASKGSARTRSPRSAARTSR